MESAEPSARIGAQQVDHAGAPSCAPLRVSSRHLVSHDPTTQGPEPPPQNQNHPQPRATPAPKSLWGQEIRRNPARPRRSPKAGVASSNLAGGTPLIMALTCDDARVEPVLPHVCIRVLRQNQGSFRGCSAGSRAHRAAVDHRSGKAELTHDAWHPGGRGHPVLLFVRGAGRRQVAPGQGGWVGPVEPSQGLAMRLVEGERGHRAAPEPSPVPGLDPEAAFGASVLPHVRLTGSAGCFPRVAHPDGPAAVDEDFSAATVGAVVGSEEGCDGGDLSWLADPA